jgi:hypothetical protein
MKTNTDYPYNFFDLTNTEVKYISSEVGTDELTINVKLGNYNRHDSIDIVLELENTQTFYRDLFRITENNWSRKMSFNLLGNTIKYTLMMVAKQDGSIEINGDTDYYECGDCIGILEKDSIVLNQEKGLTGLIRFGIGKDKIAYDLSNDWITIELPEKTHEKLQRWIKHDNSTPFVLASFGNGCIQYSLSEIINSNNISGKWQDQLSRLLTANGYNIEELDTYDIPNVANLILGNCIEKMVSTAVPEIESENTESLA